MKKLESFFQVLIIRSVQAYQCIRPFYDQVMISIFGGVSSCKHSPSCSEYMILSIKKYGTMRGLLRGIWRIFTCV